MLKNQFTPGPWRIAFETRIEYGPYVAGKGFAVAEVFRDPVETGMPEEYKANARLIAAAPDLLDATQAVLDKLENMTTAEFSAGADKEVRENLAAAIAKATKKGAT